MSLQPHLIEFFENLPYLPLCEISKHLDPWDLIKLSFLSKNWRNAIPKRDWKELTWMEYNCKDGKSELSIAFDEDNIYFSNRRFKLCNILGEINEIIVKKTGNFEEEIQIFASSKEGLALKNQNLIDTCNFWISREKKFCLAHWESDDFSDSTWIQKTDILKLNCRFGNLGVNNLTSEDLNSFLKQWMDGFNQMIIHLTIPLQNGVKIEEIVKGLKTEPWDPEKRDRKFLVSKKDSSLVFLPSIDLANGLDIHSCSGNHATVHITEDQKTFHFCVWNELFLEQSIDELLSEYVQLVREDLRKGYNISNNEKTLQDALQSLRNIRGNQ